MTAVAGRDPSEHDFIGQVFSKASPILTWRPVKVQRITPAPPVAEGGQDGSLLERISRAPTKRMVAWPVMPGVRASRAHAVRALLTLVAFSLLCGAALTLCVYVLVAEEPSASRASAASVRVGTRHVASETFDSLASLTPSATAPAASAAPPLEPAAPRHAPAASWHTRHGKSSQRSHRTAAK